MRLSNRQILDSIESLGELQRTQIPAVLSFRLAKIIMAVDPMVKAINLTRTKLLDAHAEKGDDGKPVTEEDGQGNIMVKLAAPEVFQKELDALLDAENELPFERVVVSELDGLNVTPLVFIKLDWLFEG